MVLSRPLTTAALFVSLCAASIPSLGQNTDSAIQSRVERALAAASLDTQPVTASTIDGQVTLSGSVTDAATRDRIAQTVARVPGVLQVDNNIALGTPASARQAQAQAEQQDEQSEGSGGVQQYPTTENQSDQAQGDQGQNSMSDPSAANQAPDSQASNGQQQTSSPQVRRRPYPGGQQAPTSTGQAPDPDMNTAAVYQQQQQTDTSQYVPASGPITLAPGAILKVRTLEQLDSHNLQLGAPLQFTAAMDIYSGPELAIPRGATLLGQVISIGKTGDVAGHDSVGLRLTGLLMGGKTYPLTSDVWIGAGPGKGGYTTANTVGAGAVGAVIGAIAGGGPGAAIGAAAGGVTGLAVSSVTKGPRLRLPAEAIVTFHLSAPLTVNPASQREVARLASLDEQRQNVSQQEQRQNGYPGYPGGPYPYPYPYAYPSPYYMGGPYGYYGPRYFYGPRW